MLPALDLVESEFNLARLMQAMTDIADSRNRLRTSAIPFSFAIFI